MKTRLGRPRRVQSHRNWLRPQDEGEAGAVQNPSLRPCADRRSTVGLFYIRRSENETWQTLDSKLSMSKSGRSRRITGTAKVASAVSPAAAVYGCGKIRAGVEQPIENVPRFRSVPTLK